MYKHRHGFFHGTLGWVALPNMFMLQVVFPFLFPIGDAVFLTALFRTDLKLVLLGYMIFVLMDFICSFLAFFIEKRPKHLLWLILIQRFFYRQFMYIVTFKSLLAILRGRRYGWNKLKRTGCIDMSKICPSHPDPVWASQALAGPVGSLYPPARSGRHVPAATAPIAKMANLRRMVTFFLAWILKI
jgi:hypothetical protein